MFYDPGPMNTLPDRFAALSTPDQVRRFCDQRLAGADAARTELVSAKRSVAKALEPFDRIAAELDAAANAASLLRSVHPDEAVRNRRVRARGVVAEVEADDEREDKVKEAEVDEDEDEEDEAVTPELDAVVADPTLAAEGDDDDEDAPEAPPAVSEDLGEFTDDEEVEDDAGVPFLEDEDEDDFDESEIEGLPDGDDDR